MEWLVPPEAVARQENIEPGRWVSFSAAKGSKTQRCKQQARLKSLYRARGIPVPGPTVYSIRHREEWQKQLPASARRRAARLYAELDFLIEQKRQIFNNVSDSFLT